MDAGDKRYWMLHVDLRQFGSIRIIRRQYIATKGVKNFMESGNQVMVNLSAVAKYPQIFNVILLTFLSMTIYFHA